MFSPTKHVMAEYRTLLIKMAIDNLSNEKAKTNFDLLCDVQVMLGFVAILILLHFYSQSHQIQAMEGCFCL